MLTRVSWLIPALILFGSHAAYAQQGCENLVNLKLPNTLITSAASVPEGAARAPAAPGAPAASPGTVPAHCDVRGVIRPSRDSEIKFALWLPVASAWNAKYRQEGNGGWAGVINTASFAEPLRRGYAVAGTDDGHEGGGGANWAIGHPEKLIDFGYRAVHETAMQSKAIIRAFYGRDPERSYFNGCSDGGREALMEAQRFPEDFNGILAGAPANNWSRLFTAFVWNERALLATPDSAIPPVKLPVIQRAVMAACDRLDGVADGLIENPLACRFDPAVLVCKGVDATDCLQKAQVDALQKVYEGPRNPRTQERLFVGQPPGTEAVPGSWGTWITPANAAGAIQFAFGNSYYGAAVFEDPKWNFRMLDFDRDVSIGDAKAGPVLNATSPDLRSFRASGGKLIQYPRVGRRRHSRAEFDRVLRDRARLSLEIPGCAHAWRSADRGFLPAVSRARDGALWWRLGREQFRQRGWWSGDQPGSGARYLRGTGAMGRARHRAGTPGRHRTRHR